jgi:hypothetical protein
VPELLTTRGVDPTEECLEPRIVRIDLLEEKILEPGGETGDRIESTSCHGRERADVADPGVVRIEASQYRVHGSL